MGEKIGIVTLYYLSTNYGGCFQAYALTITIGNKMSGDRVEQISYPMWEESHHIDWQHLSLKQQLAIVKKDTGNIFSFLIVVVKRFTTKLIRYFKCQHQKWHSSTYQLIDTKKDKAFLHFTKLIIPHSDKVYTSENISETLSQYDAFITGSDQVWNTNWYTPVFFLDFVPSDKIKISYAASISKDSLTDKEKEIFKKSLADFKAVSVREEQAVDLIKDLSPVKPVVTLDPTLLLDASDWDKVCAPRVVEDDYIFCYFLGDNPKERKIAKKFAKEKGLKLVSVPLTGVKVYSDLKFGDVILPAASPEEFISLIKHASYVFTDSFHAVVFSQIYQRQFFVFNRDAKGSMNSRIINITNLFNTQERFCNGKEKETLQYVKSLQEIDFSRPNPKFDEMKEFSINFLKENLK